MRVRVGTSGWNYPHWKGVFYPDGLKSGEWLSFYARRFDTIELNVTFYRQPKQEVFRKWRDTVPAGFLFSMKMSRFITHIKRLRVGAASIERFMEGAEALGEALGVILIQLPPGLEFDRKTVTGFLALLDGRFRYAIEARNPGFVNEEFFSLLKERNVAWCISESAGRYPYVEAVTADFVYLRLHGRESLYASSYRDDELSGIREKLLCWGKDAYAYFDNDAQGFAALNAATLKGMVEG